MAKTVECILSQKADLKKPESSLFNKPVLLMPAGSKIQYCVDLQGCKK